MPNLTISRGNREYQNKGLKIKIDSPLAYIRKKLQKEAESLNEWHGKRRLSYKKLMRKNKSAK